jgi:voltage-gated potassium channel Kch
MLTNVLIGILMMILTTGVHSVFTVVSLLMLNRSVHRRQELHLHQALVLIAGTILLFFTAVLAEVGVWAVAYLMLGAVEGVEASLYYSMVTFTTLGYGDIVLSDRWRLLSSFEAANGIIMLGWTTAVVMAVVQRTFGRVLEQLHRERRPSDP